MNTQSVDEETKIQVLKAQAVRQAMCEVIAEHRQEIVDRAKAKLVAMGIEVKDDELTPAAPAATPESGQG